MSDLQTALGQLIRRRKTSLGDFVYVYVPLPNLVCAGIAIRICIRDVYKLKVVIFDQCASNFDRELGRTTGMFLAWFLDSKLSGSTIGKNG